MEKLLVGLNFYGRDFSSSGLKDVLGHDYTAALEQDGAVLHWDEAYQEYKLTYNERGQTHQMFYPSTKSLQVSTQRQAMAGHKKCSQFGMPDRRESGEHHSAPSHTSLLHVHIHPRSLARDSCHMNVCLTCLHSAVRAATYRVWPCNWRIC